MLPPITSEERDRLINAMRDYCKGSGEPYPSREEWSRILAKSGRSIPEHLTMDEKYVNRR